MLRTILAIVAMGAAVAIFSCSGGSLTSGNDAGRGGAGGDGSGPRDASSDACPGTFVPASCYRLCDGSYAAPIGNGCPAGYTYAPPVCYPGFVGIDGGGPVVNTCGMDGGADAAPDGPTDARSDACSGVFIPASCYRNCDMTYHTAQDGGTCAPGQFYQQAICSTPSTDGFGPIMNNCGADGGGGCTNLPNDAPPSPFRYHSGARPASERGAGGLILDGTYDLNGTDGYGYSDGIPDQTLVSTIRISNGGTRMEFVWGYPGATTPAVAIEQALATSGTQVTETDTCWSGYNARSPTTEDYTATSDRLMFSNPSRVARYVRRP